MKVLKLEITATRTLACEVLRGLLNQTTDSVPTSQTSHYVSREV